VAYAELRRELSRMLVAEARPPAKRTRRQPLPGKWWR
jgi:hypothetical protein